MSKSHCARFSFSRFFNYLYFLFRFLVPPILVSLYNVVVVIVESPYGTELLSFLSLCVVVYISSPGVTKELIATRIFPIIAYYLILLLRCAHTITKLY